MSGVILNLYKGNYTQSELNTLCSVDGNVVLDSNTKRLYAGFNTTANKAVVYGSNVDDVTWNATTNTLTIQYINGTSQTVNMASFEKTANKVTSVTSSSTNTQYPSAKCVYDNFSLKPVVIWEAPTLVQGIVPSNTDISQNPTWQLTNLDMSGCKYVELYVRLNNNNYIGCTSSNVIEIDLSTINKSSFGHFLGSSVRYMQPSAYEYIDWVILYSLVDTGLTVGSETEIQTYFSRYSNSVGNFIYCTNAGDGIYHRISAFLGASDGSFSSGNWRFGTGNTISIRISINDGWITSRQNINGVWLNDISQGTYTNADTFTLAETLKIGFNVKLNYIKVTNGNTLVGNYRAVRQLSTGYYGLLDLVSGTFYGNASNTGSIQSHTMLATSAAVSENKTSVLFNKCTVQYGTEVNEMNNDAVLYRIVGYYN